MLITLIMSTTLICIVYFFMQLFSYLNHPNIGTLLKKNFLNIFTWDIKIKSYLAHL